MSLENDRIGGSANQTEQVDEMGKESEVLLFRTEDGDFVRLTSQGVADGFLYTLGLADSCNGDCCVEPTGSGLERLLKHGFKHGYFPLPSV